MTLRCHQQVLRLRRRDGFTLLEVLVALLVLAIGLVGIASLHLNGLRNAHSSYYTTIASSVALDFEERLWIAMTDVPDGCLDGSADILPIIAALEGDWGDGGAGTISVPGLQIDLANYGTFRADPVNSQNDFWAEAQIRITWVDDRFGGGEVFPYTARVVCAPASN